MKNIILEHVNRYPLIEIQDIAKLIYQSEFGGGHMISDSQMSLKRIQEEYNSLSEEALCVPSDVEIIGNGLLRIYLSCMKHGISADVLNEMFVYSANNKKGTVAGLEEKIALVISMCQDGSLSYPTDKAIEFFKAWENDGYPAISHSETYRQNYHPAYRVIEDNFAKLYRVICEMNHVLHSFNCSEDGNTIKPYVVAIDGMSGSGKSTFANLLHKIFPESNLFHMDDYFLRPAQRTKERLSEVGGNVDYERFYEEIICHLSDKNGLHFQKYDCCTMTLNAETFASWNPLVIIEGSYSHHPYFGDAYDLRVFLEVSSEVQRKRILDRNGSEMLKRFESEWIPKENTYFEKFNIKENAAI